MSGDTHSRHCFWLMLVVSLAHITDAGSGYVGHRRRLLSELPDTMVFPSGLNAMLHTMLVWPVMIGWPTGWPVSVLHNCTVLRLPEAMRCPSGLNTTLLTVPVPESGWPICWPVAASHTRTLSELPEAMRCPSGLNA